MSKTDARQKIIDCARELFTRNGIEASSLRAVAAHAGVAPSLIIYHFGSKQGLCEAVDAELVKRFAAAYASQEPSLVGRSRALKELMLVAPELLTYLGRALGEGGEATTGLVQRIMAAGLQDVRALKKANIVESDVDEEWFVLHHLLLLLGPLMLLSSVQATLGRPLLEHDALERWATANERLLSEGYYRSA
jgi:TetR/AcrR family transcriptional regulator, regulator of cefoperazone and chloramphenicol sensitivity